MAKTPGKSQQIRDAAERLIKQKLEEIELNKKIIDSLGYINEKERERQKLALDLEAAQERYNSLYKLYELNFNQLDGRQKKALTKTLADLDKQRKLLIEISKVEKQRVENAEKLGKMLAGIIVPATKSFWTYLQNSDKAMKTLNLNMGKFGTGADIVSKNLQQSSMFAASLGVSVEELAKMQQGYSDELGRAVILTENQYKAITEIAKGTALGVENATNFAAQLDLIGGNAENARDIIEGVADATQRMGLNTGKVLKDMNTNFKLITKYNFKQGVRGITDMAMYAAKFRVDIQDAVDSTEKARTLEGAVDLVSKLQVLGGQFAKSDPFEMLYLSRNDPAQYTKKLNEMTKGMAALVKTADGFDFNVSALDRDRLRQFAEATGQDFGKVMEQALRQGQISAIKKELFGKNLKKEDREFIENLAILDKKTGKFLINDKDISKLTEKEIEQMKGQKATLEERAKAAQNFNEALLNTLNELKAAMLPLLNVINKGLEWFNEFRGGISETTKKVAGMILGGGTLLLGGAKILLNVVGGLKTVIKGLGSAKGLASGFFGVNKKGGGVTDILTKSTTSVTQASGNAGSSGGGAFDKMFGKASPAKINSYGKAFTGLGVAAAGAGVGIGAAAFGISKLAESMKELNGTQIAGLAAVVLAIGGAMSLVLVPAIYAIGAAGTAGAVGLLAIGGAALMIGAGIGVAAAGIGYLATGVGDLLESASKVNPKDILTIAGAIGGIGIGISTMGNPLAILGTANLMGILSLLESKGNVAETANSINSMITALKGSGDDLKTLESVLKNISSMEVGDDSVVSKLASLFDKPLKVEFAQKDVGLNVNVDLFMDKEKVARSLNLAKRVELQQVEQKNGKGSAR